MNTRKIRNVLMCCLAGCFLAFFMPGCTLSYTAASSFKNAGSAGGGAPRYIFFLVPDGMGLSNVTAARIYKNGPGGAPLTLERLPYIGYQRTHSKNSTVTDSAAAASAWASGEKFNNGEISCHDDNGDGLCDGTLKNPQTILELAAARGMGTGLVATSDITHATPAVWGAHVHSRKCESEIFSQFLDLGIDVLLGGGIAANHGACLLEPTDDTTTEALIQRARNEGYAYVTTEKEMIARQASAKKILGVFNSGGLSPLYTRSSASTEPTLGTMTRAALEVLQGFNSGFFLLVEGSQVDWANHDNDMVYQIHETLDFDNAVKVILDWVNGSEIRKKNSLVIVVPDHDCGGFGINGPKGRLSVTGNSAKLYKLKNDAGVMTDVIDDDGNPIYAPDFEAGWTSDGHTAVDTLIWSTSSECARPMDNTDLFHVMKNFLYGTW